jgi:hypothetical protein
MFMASSFVFWIEPRPVELKCTSYHIRAVTGISMRWRTTKLPIHKRFLHRVKARAPNLRGLRTRR